MYDKKDRLPIKVSQQMGCFSPVIFCFSIPIIMQIEQAQQQQQQQTTSENMPEIIELDQLTEAMKKEQEQIPAIRAARESDDYFAVDPYSLLKEEARLQSLTASVRWRSCWVLWEKETHSCMGYYKIGVAWQGQDHRTSCIVLQQGSD